VTGAIEVSLNSDVFTASEIPDVRRAVSTTLASTLGDLGLPSEWDLDVKLHADPVLCQVTADQVRLPLSARRDYRITAGVLGEEMASEASRHVNTFMLERAAGRTPESRRDLVSQLVRSRALVSMGMLMDRDSGEVSPAGATVNEFAHIAAPLRLAARLGVAPNRLESIWSGEISPDQGSHYSCENLLQELNLDQEAPVIELNEATLRLITTSPNLLRSWSLSPPGPTTSLGTTVGLAAALWNVYGVAAPGCELVLNPQIPSQRFRFRFGEIATVPYHLLPDDVVALTYLDPDSEPPDPLGWTLDPVGGGWWPLVPVSWVRALPAPGHGYLDTIGLLMRTLYSEMQTRMARWYSLSSAMDELTLLDEPLRGEVRARLPMVTRWLLADGVSVGQPGPVLEGVARALASDDPSVESLIRHTRQQLGGAVIGHAPPEHPLVVVPLDPAACEAAASSRSPEPLLTAHSELETSTATLLAVCSEQYQLAVADLLRPLVDVVRVVSAREIEHAAIHLPSAQGV
jgi:hypothetical protein